MCARFGPPFVLHLDRTVAWDLLQKEILEKMKYFLRPTVCIQVCVLLGAPPSTRVCQPGHRHRGDSGLGALRQAGLGAGGVGPGASVPWGRRSSDCQDWGLALI